MRVIISGFDAFDGGASNPSQGAVEQLPEHLTSPTGESIQVQKVVLPTCCGSAWEKLQQAIDQTDSNEKFAVVMSGLADSRDRVTPEWCALNVRHYRIADNQGHQPLSETIIAGGADALTTTIDINSLAARLNDAGVKADVSFHAGTFVCNDTYYRALTHCKNASNCAGVVFIHVPSLENYKKHGEMEPVQEYARALAEAAKFVLGF